MKIIKLTGIIFFILSYVSLGIVFIYENELDNSELSYGLFLWGLGIINVILNIIYGAKIKLPKLLFISMIISGLVWLFIPLIYTYFGLPFLVIYFFIVVYMHIQHSMQKI
jgi:hypothetical protein